MRIGRFLLLLVLLAGAGACVWYAGRPALHEFRTEQRTDDLAYAGMIAENAEQLLADPPLDLTRALGEVLTPLFGSEDNLAAVRIRDAQGRVLCEIGRDHPQDTQAPSQLTGLPPATVKAPPRDLIFRLQQLVDTQDDLSGRMEDALKAGKGDGMHNELYIMQDSNIQDAELLQTKAPKLADALASMREAVEALTHTDANSLYLAKQASEQAEGDLSLALEEQRAVTDFPGRLPKNLAAACPADLLPLRARRVTVPLYVPTGTIELIAPAGTVEVIFADRPTALPLSAAHRILAAPLRWVPPAVLLLGALLTLVIRKRRRNDPKDQEAAT